MEKLALSTNKLEKSVSEILLHQDQMLKISQNCFKLEEFRPHSVLCDSLPINFSLLFQNFRNKEQRKMEKLALSTNKLEKSVSEILLHQDQMIKLSQNCLKLEEEGDEFVEEMIELSRNEKNAIKKADKKIARYNPMFKNLDVILEKQNNVSIQLSNLRSEQRVLSAENQELKMILKEYFHTLATSSDLAGDGLLNIHRQKLKKKRRP